MYAQKATAAILVVGVMPVRAAWLPHKRPPATVASTPDAWNCSANANEPHATITVTVISIIASSTKWITRLPR
jgi:hypothetical protein